MKRRDNNRDSGPCFNAFNKYFGIKTGIENERLAERKFEDGKSSVHVLICKKKECRQLAVKLLPIANKWHENPKTNYIYHATYMKIFNLVAKI